MQKEDSNVSARVASIIATKKRRLSGKRRMCQVVDGVESLCKGGCLDALKSIRQSISVCPRAVVFNNFLSGSCVLALQNLLLGSLVDCLSICLFPVKVLYVVGNDSNSFNLVKMLKINGYTVSTGSNHNISDDDNRLKLQIGSWNRIGLDMNVRRKPLVFVINVEHILYSFPILQSIDNYVQIHTRMARYTINGVSHSFLTKEDAPIAGPLNKILEQCGQAVPDALRNLHLTSSMLES
ncbi:hypothetical protein Peur_006644 [Populus x canadensis]